MPRLTTVHLLVNKIQISDIDVCGPNTAVTVCPGQSLHLREWDVREFSFCICFQFPVKIHPPKACVPWAHTVIELLRSAYALHGAMHLKGTKESTIENVCRLW